MDDGKDDKSTSEAVTAETSECTCEKTGTTSSNWSISEDALLRGMKEGGETWAETARAMQRSKNEVKSRWRVVEKLPRADDEGDEGKPDQKYTKRGC